MPVMLTGWQMNLKFLGVGGFFSKTLGHSNLILRADNGQQMLIDAGFRIADTDCPVVDLDAVYISHMHGDHAGGLEWIALARYFSTDRKIKLFSEQSLIPQIWQMLSPSLRLMTHRKFKWPPCDMGIEDYFECHPVTSEFAWEGCQFKLARTDHIGYSYGLIINTGKNVVYFSSDSKIQPFLPEEVSIIFHDCETMQPPSGVHAHYDDLRLLPSHMKSKMWLYHYSDGEKPNPKSDGFAGFVEVGQSFEI